MWGGSSENGVKFCNGHVAPFGLCISGGHGKIFHFLGLFLCLLSFGQAKESKLGCGVKNPTPIGSSEIENDCIHIKNELILFRCQEPER